MYNLTDMYNLTEKLTEDCARAKTLAEVIDEKLLHLYPEKRQMGTLTDIVNLTSILVEQLEEIRMDAEALERTTLTTS